MTTMRASGTGQKRFATDSKGTQGRARCTTRLHARCAVASPRCVKRRGSRRLDHCEIAAQMSEEASHDPDYDDTVVARLQFVRCAQAAGLTLSEIASVIELRDEGAAPCEHVGRLLDAKLSDVRERIGQLRVLEGELGRLVERARTLDPAECVEPAICHILHR